MNTDKKGRCSDAATQQNPFGAFDLCPPGTSRPVPVRDERQLARVPTGITAAIVTGETNKKKAEFYFYHNLAV